MARYLVLERSFIDFRLVEPGVEIDYAGKPDGNLAPLDAEAEAAVEARAAEVAEIAQAAKAKAAEKNVADLL